MPYVRQRTRIQMAPRGMGQAGWFSDFMCSTGLLTPNSATCSAASAAQSAALPPPVLAPGSISPGLPVGYDPNTGLISENTGGATQVNPYSVDLTGYPNVVSTGTGAGLVSSLAGVPGWAWAVGVTLGAVVLLNAFGGRR